MFKRKWTWNDTNSLSLSSIKQSSLKQVVKLLSV